MTRPTGAATTDGEHIHRWRIEAQGGPTSAGVCLCGAERQFANSWDRETTAWSAARSRGSKNAGAPRD